MHASANPRFFLVLPAAGTGLRMQQTLPKQYLEVLNAPVLQHTLERIGSYPAFSAIYVAVAANDPWFSALAAALPAGISAKLFVVTGGEERAQSVANALDAMQTRADPDDWVLVHDAVRPCVSREDIDLLVTSLGKHPVGGILASPVRETLKRTDAQGNILATVDRRLLWQAATPQMFRYQTLREALALSAADRHPVTDEASAVEYWMAKNQDMRGIQVIKGRPDNIKITFAEDLVLAAKILSETF